MYLMILKTNHPKSSVSNSDSGGSSGSSAVTSETQRIERIERIENKKASIEKKKIKTHLFQKGMS